MKLRLLAVAAVLPMAVAGLTACQTNVGTAATVDGQRITESDVARYLTPNAEAVPQQDQATGAVTSVPARAWVLQTLLDQRLYLQLLAHTPGGAPSESEIAASQQALLQGTSASTVADQYVQHGYQRSFAPIYLRTQAIEQILGQKIQNGVDARALITSLHPSVSVNPRYGSWDPTAFALTSDVKAGLPGFLTVGPGATYAPGAPSPSASGAGSNAGSNG